MPDFMTVGWGPGRWWWFTSYNLMGWSIGIGRRNDGLWLPGYRCLQCRWPRSQMHIQMLKQNLRWTSLGWFLRLSKLFSTKATHNDERNCTTDYVYKISEYFRLALEQCLHYCMSSDVLDMSKGYITSKTVCFVRPEHSVARNYVIECNRLIKVRLPKEKRGHHPKRVKYNPRIDHR